MAGPLALAFPRQSGRIKPVFSEETDPTLGSDYVYVLGIDQRHLAWAKMQEGSASILEQVFTPSASTKTIKLDLRMRFDKDGPLDSEVILLNGPCSLVKGGTFTRGSTSDSMILLDLGTGGTSAFSSKHEGQEIVLSGFTNAANNDRFRVSAVLTDQGSYTISPAGRYALIEDPTGVTVAETATNVTIVTQKFRWVVYVLLDGTVHAEVSEQEVQADENGVYRKGIVLNVSKATSAVTLDVQLGLQRVA